MYITGSMYDYITTVPVSMQRFSFHVYEKDAKNIDYIKSLQNEVDLLPCSFSYA